MAISVHMFGLRLTIDAQPRSKNGSAHHKHDRGCEHEFDPRRRIRRATRARAGRPSVAIAMMNNGTVSASPIQKRRVKSIKFRIGAGVGGGDTHRLERHAADRAVAGFIAE